MARIELQGVTKRFSEGGQSHPALDAVDLTIESGETLSVVGPSGCGKSTLLKVVAGLEFPDAGSVFYDGEDVTDVRPKDRGVGMVFQDYALYPTRKGEGNLKYYFEVRGTGESEKMRRVHQTAELMGVDFELLLGQQSTTLSGGEQQRVAIARCIVRDPQLFLMDEPIVNLDAKLRERTRMEMRKLLKTFAVTTLFVTHDQQEAIFMGDRIAVMRAGRVEQVGTFDDLYFSPANAFVAGFIGAPKMAFLPAALRSGKLEVAATLYAVPAGLAMTEGAVRLGVRPEGWRLGAADGLELKVRHTERLPTERATYLHGTVAGTNVAVLAPLEHPETPSVRITPDWTQAYLFEANGEGTLYTPEQEDLF